MAIVLRGLLVIGLVFQFQIQLTLGQGKLIVNAYIFLLNNSLFDMLHI